MSEATMAITRTTSKPRCGCALHEYSHTPTFYYRPCSVTPCRLRCAAVLLSAASVLAASTVQAETWRLVSSLGILETLTNNVNLAPSGSARSDLVTQLTPTLSISELGARTRLNGSVSMPVVLYARTGSENGDQVYAQASLNGTVEAVEKFFFIDGTVLVSQQYLSPLGAQPVGLANATQNRYTAESYSVGPYIKGRTLGDVEYLIRDDNQWSKASGAAVSGVNGAYTNHFLANVSKLSGRLGWAVDYDRNAVTFQSEPQLRTQLARLRLLDSPDPQLQLSASVGYEDNDFGLTQDRGTIYGVGAKWHPTDRTLMDASWEHRFFGSSYLFNFTHRMPLTVWNLNASRNITSYPQQLASLAPGFDVQSLLNQLFSSSIPDPAQRQTFIDQFIRNRGLPAVLSSPVNLFSDQITLIQQVTASAGLIGARNSVFFSLFHTRQQPVSATNSDLSGLLAAQNNNTQNGASVVWTHALSPSTVFSLTGTASRGVSDVAQTEIGGSATSRQGAITANLTSPLSANTSATAGIRYQVFRSDLSSNYTEAAAFVGVNHTFR
jgi:uncharacterized protein (PEP-CTERM system associated)